LCDHHHHLSFDLLRTPDWGHLLLLKKHHEHLMLRILLAHLEQELVVELRNEKAREVGLKIVCLLLLLHHHHLELVLVWKPLVL
jgi:hypothetical protein